MQACEALAEAHSLGIIHRDIKLANLFVTRGPAGGPLVKVLDFGISKTNPFGESEHEMTRTSSMLGSPRFMSPEQMRDPRAVDGRSDIWSLGVVLYRLIAGRPPFEADTLGRLLTMVMHEQFPPLSSVAPGGAHLPPNFDMVIARCLEKDPQTRFSNVAELAYALAGYCIEPQRARGAADRIAAMLGAQRSLEISAFPGAGPSSPALPPTSNRSSHVNRPSTPPGASDTGTAAPWAGTHGGTGPVRPAPRGGAAWILVAVAALLVGSGIFVKVRHDRAVAAAAASQGQPAGATTLVATPTPPVSAPTITTEEPPPAPVPPSTVIGASHQPATPTTGSPSISPPERPTNPGTPRKPIGGVKPSGRPANQPTRPAKGDDGIPTTRD